MDSGFRQNDKVIQSNMAKPTKKSKRGDSSETEKKVLKWLKGIKNPKPVLKAIGYFISDDGETKSEISQNSY
ncbi:MAG: hypothetical protein A2599_00470 [Candidatus Staskawiczbacteria bacterium RIFOXYD1_FULL_39_28]|uniref:Uncharacterized protein n=1 Tax=Candidatus Staskawiczbacteria bacterium RIFOXYC1_FULL_38_18 TaxID=1802229 RepID=A0A1G2JCL0_9BACT|nr:MAG: hypothetical protein A2401_02075 [Candidatus Staskawiczbacteria bacterium RIFOXYC1_FULL_38_18]OGZ90846.1 MAG: hypothetical protein A2599_00470 [Candidatus Staskawiczbacteria bacterium RIFOXYD1_FULL_39_28]